MKKFLIPISLLTLTAGSAAAQSAMGAYGVAQPDLKGTARFMGMAGAFGALGGDLSSISQNPAGIGVYRSSDIGFTLDLDLQSSSTESDGKKSDRTQTKFLLNNIGAVLTLKLGSKTCPNFNFGFTYNKGASFNRIFDGSINNIRNSMSNYIAAIADAYGVTEGDVSYDDGMNPYDVDYGYFQAPWLTVLGYHSYLITPDVDPSTGKTRWNGLWDNQSMTGNNTSGNAHFLMQESGCTNDFNIVFGGNINNVFYWGMNFDIVNMNYSLQSIWGENLTNAMVPGPNNSFNRESARWDLNSIYTLSGTGFNYQLGFIVKPVQQLRLGFAFHTPTWYNLTEEYGGRVNYLYGGEESGTVLANEGIPGYTNYNLRTPWKIIASAAGVLGNNLIISFDYEWANYGAMHYSEPGYYNGGYGGWFDPWDPWPYAASTGPLANSRDYNPNDPYGESNYSIRSYYKSQNTFRAGIEFKPISSVSLRAGYSFVSSPVKDVAKDNQMEILTTGLTPSYRFDNNTNYITCGVGYRYSRFYVDLAYIYKHMTSEYHAFTPDTGLNALPSPQSKVSLTNNQVVLSAGFRF